MFQPGVGPPSTNFPTTVRSYLRLELWFHCTATPQDRLFRALALFDFRSSPFLGVGQRIFKAEQHIEGVVVFAPIANVSESQVARCVGCLTAAVG